jgi:hypothetical protein
MARIQWHLHDYDAVRREAGRPDREGHGFSRAVEREQIAALAAAGLILTDQRPGVDAKVVGMVRCYFLGIAIA